MYDIIEEYFLHISCLLAILCVGVIWMSYDHDSLESPKIVVFVSGSVTNDTETVAINEANPTITFDTGEEENIVSEKREPIVGTGNLLLVKRVIDGDTIDLGLDENVRILGMDAPESNSVRYGYVECDGTIAKNYATEMLLGRQVLLSLDNIQPVKDRYNRYLFHVWIDGELFSEKIIRAGLAKKYTGAETKYSSLLLDAEQDAKNNNKGLWGDCN